MPDNRLMLSSMQYPFAILLLTLVVFVGSGECVTGTCAWTDVADTMGATVEAVSIKNITTTLDACKSHCDSEQCVAVDWLFPACNLYKTRTITTRTAGRTYAYKTCTQVKSFSQPDWIPTDISVPSLELSGTQTQNEINANLTPDEGFAQLQTATDYISPGPYPTLPPPPLPPATTPPPSQTTRRLIPAPATSKPTTTTRRQIPVITRPFPPILSPESGPKWSGGDYQLGNPEPRYHPPPQPPSYPQAHSMPNINGNINPNWLWLLMLAQEP